MGSVRSACHRGSSAPGRSHHPAVSTAHPTRWWWWWCWWGEKRWSFQTHNSRITHLVVAGKGAAMHGGDQPGSITSGSPHCASAAGGAVTWGDGAVGLAPLGPQVELLIHTRLSLLQSARDTISPAAATWTNDGRARRKDVVSARRV
ncbi:unnamed protein product [Pleuronectes platessa]|uniref:Uncharacterized protein n=1 Tax=Pleuronectes platessa TaxID=8262 RepID=A0A9N7VHR9_PLEPL|nr:unnamed protein product [Pleuronectes platessa]